MRTIKVSFRLVSVCVLLICLHEVHQAQTRGPSTPEERAKVIELTRWLEENPLAENAPATRQWLQQWINDVPDIRFKVCNDLMGHALGDYPYSREVKLQTLFSGAAFTLQHQDRARDDAAVYSAGVEGTLQMYEALLRSKPDAKSAFLDDLVSKRERGELVDHIARLAREKCKSLNILLIAVPAGAAVGFLLALFVARWFGARRLDRVATPSPKVSTRIVTISQRIVFICAAYYLIAGIALHFLEPEYDPRFRFMSEYVWGAYGWLMTTTFFVLGLAIFAVAIGLRDVHQSSWSARIGFGLLVIGALFICLAGVFKEFTLHSVASAIGIPSTLLAVLVLSWSFRRVAEWRRTYGVTLLIALGMLVALLSLIVDVGLPGLQQRAFLFLLLVWLSIVVHRLVRVTIGATHSMQS